MKLLLLLSFICLAFGLHVVVAQQVSQDGDISQQATNLLEVEPNVQEVQDEKKLTKRGYLLGGLGYGYGHGYGLGYGLGHGLGYKYVLPVYSKVYVGYPSSSILYSGYGGYRGYGGYYKGW